MTGKNVHRSHADRVLSVLATEEKPKTAYQILDALRAEGVTAPTTVYRALDRLVASGAVHRLESLNAYVACTGSHNHGLPVFAICTGCGSVSEEVDGRLASDVSAIAGRLDFAPESSVLEVRGRCGPCREETRRHGAADDCSG